MDAPPPGRTPPDDDVGRFLDEQRRARRTRVLIAAIGGVVVVAGVAAVVIATRPALPAVDQEKLDDVGEALAEMPSELRQPFAAAALAELELGRLPPPLVRALADVERLPPEMRALRLAEGLADPDMLAVWKQVCPDGPRALAEAIALVPEQQAASFCRVCAAACRHVAPHGNLAAVATAAVAGEVLERGGGLKAVEGELLRALAGQ